MPPSGSLASSTWRKGLSSKAALTPPPSTPNPQPLNALTPFLFRSPLNSLGENITPIAVRFPISFHWNPRANGTMILNAMMYSPVGVSGIQVGTLNPYNGSEWAQLYECDVLSCVRLMLIIGRQHLNQVRWQLLSRHRTDQLAARGHPRRPLSADVCRCRRLLLRNSAGR